MVLGGEVVIGIEDHGEVGVGLEELGQLLVVLEDLLAFLLEVEVLVDAEWRILSNVHAQLADMALLSYFKAVAAHHLVLDMEFEDFLLFCDLH